MTDKAEELENEIAECDFGGCEYDFLNAEIECLYLELEQVGV